MTELNPQVKQIRVPLSVWTLARYVLRTGRDTFTYTEVKNAACGSIDTALVMGLIVRLDNGLYKADMELAKLYASLLPKAYVPDRKGRWGSPLASSGEKSSCEARDEGIRLAWAWLKLAKWAEAHAEDAEDPPKKVLEVLKASGWPGPGQSWRSGPKLTRRTPRTHLRRFLRSSINTASRYSAWSCLVGPRPWSLSSLTCT